VWARRHLYVEPSFACTCFGAFVCVCVSLNIEADRSRLWIGGRGSGRGCYIYTVA
jgi:hypothetical protein